MLFINPPQYAFSPVKNSVIFDFGRIFQMSKKHMGAGFIYNLIKKYNRIYNITV